MFPLCLPAVSSERHIGIDQGRHNFAIVAVDKYVGQKPVVISAEIYDLDLPVGAKADKVLTRLQQRTDLSSLMQQTSDRQYPAVDRVVVHLEQLSISNRQWKEFGIELGTLLQRCVADIDTCVVKLSSPHLYRPGGVIDHLGPDIVNELGLVHISCTRRQSSAPQTSSTTTRRRPGTTRQSSLAAKRRRTGIDDEEDEDVQPSDSSDYDNESAVHVSSAHRRSSDPQSSLVVKMRRVVGDDDEGGDVEPSDDDDTDNQNVVHVSSARRGPSVMKRQSIISDTEDDEDVELSNVSSSYQQSSSKAENEPTANDDDDDILATVEDIVSDDDMLNNSAEYRLKKRMSASFFRYFVDADDDKQDGMGVAVDDDMQQLWRRRLADVANIKLDDLGDALIHALNDIVCGGSNYRQLVPSNISLHCNRTVVLAVKRDYTHWAVLHCAWNTFELEDYGVFDTGLQVSYFKSRHAVGAVRQSLVSNLPTALTDLTGGAGLYRPVDVVRIVVKQLKGFQDLTRKQAGTLTAAAITAVKEICDESAGPASELCERKDKILGSIYIRRDPATGHKFEALSSAGKHTNAMLSCLSWMNENARSFVDSRGHSMCESAKLMFFEALRTLASSNSPDCRLELLQLSPRAREQLNLNSTRLSVENKKLVASLVLIGLNKNEPHVKAVAANYRRPAARPPRPASSAS